MEKNIAIKKNKLPNLKSYGKDQKQCVKTWTGFGVFLCVFFINVGQEDKNYTWAIIIKSPSNCLSFNHKGEKRWVYSIEMNCIPKLIYDVCLCSFKFHILNLG